MRRQAHVVAVGSLCSLPRRGHDTVCCGAHGRRPDPAGARPCEDGRRVGQAGYGVNTGGVGTLSKGWQQLFCDIA